MGLNEEEMVENERMWKEENPVGKQTAGTATGELGAMGLRGADVSSFEPTNVGAENTGDDAGDTGGADAPTPDDTGGDTGVPDDAI